MVGSMDGAVPGAAPSSFRGGGVAMGTCAVYIDGGYLDKVLRRNYSNVRIDIERLVRRITHEDKLLRAYYYHCLPYQSNPPTPEEEAHYGAKHKFFDALNYRPNFEVRLGKLQPWGKKEDGRQLYTQKRVDMMMGVDMALLAVKNRVDRMALLTGDGDTIPAVEAVKPEGVNVTLVHAPMNSLSPPSRDLYKLADDRVEIDAAMIKDLAR